jgi:hypothetical protein
MLLQVAGAVLKDTFGEVDTMKSMVRREEPELMG